MALLGKGGYGLVYRALCLTTGETVAIKLVNPDAFSTSLAAQLLRQEIALCATLRHPHIATLQDSGDGGHAGPFAVFEYVPGQTLHEHLLLKGPLEGTVAAELMGQLLDTLVYLHGRGVVHCDIKPKNIMLTPSQQICLIDFGSATPARQHICSPAYSPPEQLRGELPTSRFDLYAWGLVLLECLTGRPAITGDNLRQVIGNQHSDQPVPLQGFERHPLGVLLRQLLHKDASWGVTDTRWLRRRFCRLDLSGIVPLHAADSIPWPDDDASTEPWPSPL